MKLYLAAFALVLAAFAANYSMVGNLRYARHAETVLDILQPPRPALKDRPAILMIHGGGWSGGSKADMLPFCQPFIDRDFVVANVEYRLAGSALAPAAVSDVLEAAKWLADHAAEYKVDPRRMVAMGTSAGGHLALMVGMTPQSAELGPVTRIAGVVDFYGVADVAESWSAKRDYAVAWIGPQANPLDLAKRVSPMTYVRKDLPPVLAIHGDQDDVVPYQQSVRLQAALKQAGAKGEVITVPGGKHGFTDQEMAVVWPQIFRWLKKIKVTT